MSSSPSLLGLSDPREITFVTTLLDLGGPQYGHEAAKRAGYARTDAEADRAAALLLSHPRIAKAIAREVQRRFDIAAAGAFNTLLEVCANQRAPANARITAAQEILNRSSVGPIVSRSAVIKAEGGIEDLLDALDRKERGQPREGPMIDITPPAQRRPADETEP